MRLGPPQLCLRTGKEAIPGGLALTRWNIMHLGGSNKSP
jgi:hypothetical protein